MTAILSDTVLNLGRRSILQGADVENSVVLAEWPDTLLIDCRFTGCDLRGYKGSADHCVFTECELPWWPMPTPDFHGGATAVPASGRSDV